MHISIRDFCLLYAIGDLVKIIVGSYVYDVLLLSMQVLNGMGKVLLLLSLHCNLRLVVLQGTYSCCRMCSLADGGIGCRNAL